MADLSRESEQIARDWLCDPLGDVNRAPLRHAIWLLLEEAEAEVARLRLIVGAACELRVEERNPCPDLSLRANMREQLHRLLDEWKASEEGKEKR